MNDLTFVFFGGEPLGVPTLKELKQSGLLPSLIVCNPDRPAGRGHTLTPPPVKVWAQANDIPVWQPESIPKDRPTDLLSKNEIVQSIGLFHSTPPPEQNAVLESMNRLLQADLFVVVAYNKILPQWLIELPTYNTINVHPSLLPKLRGASPIRSAIIRNTPADIGVSIMLMDKAMDHGPLLAQQPMSIAPQAWPINGLELDTALAHQGGALLADTIPKYLAGSITPTEQAHEEATYCSRLDKSMAELTLDPYSLPTGEPAHEAYRTICAFAGIGNAWFMHEDVRYKITNAHLAGERLVIDSVIPAGKPENAFDRLFT